MNAPTPLGMDIDQTIDKLKQYVEYWAGGQPTGLGRHRSIILAHLNHTKRRLELIKAWTPVARECPPDDVEVLCWDGYCYRVGECHRYSLPKPVIEWSWRDEGMDDRFDDPTHWMPLPAKPE
jgi:hypothetical protein